jgi:hypothetical protein
MIRLVGNYSLRLWIIVLLAGPVCFYFMPLILQVFPGVHPAMSGGVLLVFIGVVIGVSLDFIGRKQIETMIKEGEIWERTGILSRAEQTYDKAVRIYDTFLLSPLFAKKLGIRLTGTLARFSLTAGIEKPHLKLASAVYLKTRPGDETLAGLWLGQLKKDGLAGAVEQEVLTALADIHYTHKNLVIPLADVLLDLGRMDYSAKRVYKALLDAPPVLEIKTAYREKIHGLLGAQADGGSGGPGGPGGPGGARESLEILENNAIGRVVSKSLHSIGLKKRFLNLASAFFTTATNVMKLVAETTASFLSFCILSFSRVIVLLRERERLRFYLRAGAMGILSVWLLFFMGNTISHILNSRAVEKEPRMIEIQIPKPFTIQVAAYLKQAHADRYAAVLNKKGIVPTITSVKGGGKTWYVVRLSEFADKASASAFGKKLKDKKIIDDFFVSNK